MKINLVTLAIAFAIAALAGYGFFAAHYGSAYRIVVTVGAFVSFFVPLAGMIALNIDAPGGNTNIRMLSALFVIAAFIDNLFFTIKIKAWQLMLIKAAFGEIIDFSGIERMLSSVPSAVFKDVGMFSLAPYIVITGILTLVYVLIAYGIAKALQN